MAPKEPDSPHAQLAKTVVESFVSQGRVPDVSDAPPELESSRAGVFVCLKIDGDLRGCIGTIEPVARNIAEEITNNAINAAIRDPRFPPVRPEELEKLTYSIDVLEDAEDIPDVSYLDPKVYGVIVRGGGGRSGLLLPDLEGVDTAEEQVRIAMMKAGIRPGEPVELQRFKVNRHD
jgi:AmmeMemoRadiSam system protein A